MALLRSQITAVLLLASVCSPAAAQETKLLMTTMSPAGSANSQQLFRPWANRINEQAKGVLSIEPRDGATLANFGNVLNRVQDDVVQIGWLLHGPVAGRFPLSEVASLPFIANTGEEASVALWRLYKSGLVDAEYRDVVPLMFGVFGQFQIHMAKPPKSLDSLSGLKISASARSQVDIVQRLGGTPMSVPSQDLYEALQRGAVDGAVIGWSAFDAYKLGEQTTFHIEVPLGATTGMIFMSRKKYESLSPEARKAIDDNSGEAASRAWGKYLDSQMTVQRDLNAASDKHKIVQLTADQSAQWHKQIEPQLSGWVASRPEGAKVMAAYQALIADVRAGK